MFNRAARLLHAHWSFRNHQQRAGPSVHHLQSGHAIFHASELSRFRNARRPSAGLSGIARLHSAARGSGPKILRRSPDRHARDRRITAPSLRKWRSLERTTWTGSPKGEQREICESISWAMTSGVRQVALSSRLSSLPVADFSSNSNVERLDTTRFSHFRTGVRIRIW